jgi:hypothetical protein
LLASLDVEAGLVESVAYATAHKNACASILRIKQLQRTERLHTQVKV